MLKGFLKVLRVLLVLAIAIAIATYLIKKKPEAARQKPVEAVVLVEVKPAKSQAVPMMVEAYGTVKPRESLKLVAEVSGRITTLAPGFVEGSQVAAQTVMIRIDPRTYGLEVDRQKSQILLIDAEIKHLDQQVRNLNASIKIAKSDAALTKAEVARIRMLIGKNVVAQTTLDRAEQRYLSSLNQLQRLENELALTGPARQRLLARRQITGVVLKQARLNLAKAAIRAPFNGWVAERRIEVGQQVHAGEYLGRIYRDGAYDVEINITAADLAWLVNERGADTGWGAVIETSNGGKTRTWHGRVARSKAQVDATTRTQAFVVEIDPAMVGAKKAAGAAAAMLRLKPGAFVTVKIKGRMVSNLFVLPRHLVHDGDVVYTMAAGRLRRKAVSVLRNFSEKAFIDDGLVEGDLIVTTPLSNAFEGMKLRLSNHKR